MPISLDEFNKRYSAVAQDRVSPLRGEFGWGDRLGAAADRFQGQLYGLGEALGFDMAEERRANEAAAAYARLRAIQDTGAPETLGETFSSPGKFIKGVGGLFVDSAPELATSLAAWPLGAAAGLGTVGRAALGAALNYPSAVGDILQNQREEAGTTRLGTAAALGVPYAAVDALGLEGALATGRVMRTGIRALDDMTGVKGALARTAANAGLNSVVEGSTETFQEGMNQLGRMSVNPDQTFINEDSLDRFGESFGAGALMGGAASAALGGWRRSDGYLPPGQDVDQGSTDLLTGETKPLQSPSTVPDEKGGQGQLFGDMGTDGTVSWLRDPQDRTPETLARYAETERLLRQIRAGMADAEATGNAARFYALQEQHDALVGELQQMDRIVSAYQAQTAQPGQMGLFSDGIQPRTDLVVRPDYAPRAPDPIDVNPTPTGNPQFALPTLALPAPQRPNPNALIATQDGIVGRERQFSGQQFNLFDGPTTFGEGATPVEDTPAGYPDTRTRDMFAETPTAMVRTMFNPLEPSQTSGARGAVAGNIRSQIMQQLQGGGDPTLATTLSLDIASKVGDLQGMLEVIDQRERAIQKNLERLDRKVTDESNLLTPEEYAAKREVLDNKLLTVEAARTLVEQYRRALTNAYAQEGAARAQGGVVVGQVPISNATEAAMRDASLAHAVAETDQRVAQSQAARTSEERMSILRDVLAQPTRNNPVARFRKALRAAGYANLDVTPQEQAEIDRITRRRADVRAATVVPPGLAKATGRLTPRASLDEQGNVTDEPVEAPAVVGVSSTQGVVSGAQAPQAPQAQQASPQKPQAPAPATSGTATSGQAPVTVSSLQRARQKILSRYQAYARASRERESQYNALADWLDMVFQNQSTKEAASSAEAAQAWAAERGPAILQAWETVLGAFIGPKQQRADNRAKLQAFRQTNDINTLLPRAVTPAPTPAASPAPARRPARTARNVPAAKAQETTPAVGQAVAERPAQSDRSSRPAPPTGKKEQRSADESTEPRQETAAAASTPENDTGNLAEVRNLIEAVENAKTDVEYDGALDALYARYMNTRSDKEADAIEAYVNESGKAFQKDWAKAGSRYDETERVQERGKRGLKLGRSSEGTKSNLDSTAVKELDGVLLSWGLPPSTKLRQAAKVMGGKPTLAAIQQAVKAVQNAARYALPISIVNNPSDLGIVAPAGTNPPGMFDGRRIYLFADNITSMLDVYFTIFHELFHLGLSKTVPQAEYHKLMRQFENDPALAPLVSAWKASPEGKSRVGTMSPRDFDALAVEEVLAQIAETLTVDGGFGTKRGPIVRALLKWFSNLASAVGMNKFAQVLRRMTQTEAEAFVSQTMQAIMGAAGNPFTPVQSGGTRLRLGAGADRQRPTTNSNGQPIHPTEEGIRNFWQWFGDSKVVDEQGRPLVVYHGTKGDFAEFRLGRADRRDGGWFGDGFYLTASQDLASSYAMRERDYSLTDRPANVMPVYVRMSNPYRINLGELSYNDGSNFTKKYGGNEGFRKWLADNGYDGVIGYRDPKIAGQGAEFWEVVVFDPAQIKSATGNSGSFGPKNPDIRFRQANTLDGRPPTDLSRMPASSRTAVKWLNRALKNSMQYLGTRGAFLLDLLESAEKYLPSVSRYRELIQRASNDKVRLERATREIVSRFQNLPASRQGTGQGSVNWLLKQSTMRKKWAFVPDWLPGVKESDLDPELRDAFNALPKNEQAIVRDVFRHGYDSLVALKAAIDAAVNEQYKAELAAAAQDPERYSAVLKKIESDKAKFSSLNNLNPNWPYAPLKRFGRFAVIGRSQAFIDLAEAVRNGEGDADALEAMRADPQHYYVEFVDTRLQAQNRVDELRSQGYIADEAERLEGDEGLLGGRDVFAAFQRLRSAAQELGEESGVGAQMNQVLRDLYLVLLSESSARQTEAGRAGGRGVAGASDDMMRAFATQGMAMANFISSVRNSGEIIDTLRDMRAEAKNGTVGTRGDRQMYYNEIARRYAMGLDYAPTPLLDAALSFNSFWTLLTNPSYFLVNALQPWTASVPYIGGRFGMGRTYEAFFRAYKDISPVAADLIKRGSDALTNLPESGMLEELMNRGRIDITLQADLGNFRSGTTMAGRLAEKALNAPRVAAERVELVNRIVTAMAAYRLAKQSGMSEQAAIDYADKAVYQTHGDYSGFNAPRFMRHPVGRVITQFRKFQLIQLTLYFKMARDTIGEIRDRDARYGAYRSLLFSLGHMMAFGGVMALPGFATLAWWAGVFDDDEPDDPEATLRRLFGEDLATLLTKGVPAALGVDISRRVGAGDMLSLLPYTDIEPEREGYLEILAGLAGPLIGGTGLRAYEAVGHFAEGDYIKGLQKALPSGFANAVKAIEYGVVGYTARNGDVLLSPDELGFMAIMGQALGLPTTTITNAQTLRSMTFKADKFFSQKAADLKRDYVEAVRSGDRDAANEALAAWVELQETRQALGYKRQPMSEILKAPRERAKRESSVVGGAPTTNANREFVRRMSELM